MALASSSRAANATHRLLYALCLAAGVNAATINAVTATMGSMQGGTYVKIAGSGFMRSGLSGTTRVCVRGL